MNNHTATIMLVDDTPANLQLLMELLREEGHRIVAFPDGPKALAAASVNPPDLILLDIRMPGMDGFAVCERLKADPALRDIPVLFISALDEVQDKVQAFAAGGADYVTKPFQAEEVHARVLVHLQNRLLQTELRCYTEELEELVAIRTMDLEEANRQLERLQKLKSDFLMMISHELRTPANGVLGMGSILAERLPPDQKSQHYADLFRQACTRLNNLIEDATMIAGLDRLTRDEGHPFSLGLVLKAVFDEQEGIRGSLDEVTDLGVCQVRGNPALLFKALGVAIQMAALFSRDSTHVPVHGGPRGDGFVLEFPLDNMSLTPEQAADYFLLDSPVRNASLAERLGLAPVVARLIMAAYGGEMSLTPHGDRIGVLTLTLRS